ncbi:hypothetical protein D3C79_923040 [compost metagenome]
MLEQAVENVREHFVRTVAEEHLVAVDPVILRHGLLEQVTVGVRVQTQIVVQLAAHGLQRLG